MIKFTCTGKSLNELYETYGKGSRGFYSHWWKGEKFADDRPEAGEYEIDIERKSLCGMTFSEQAGALHLGFSVPHPAVVVEALLSHYKETGECLMSDWYSRTSLLDSGGYRVDVGHCDAEGVRVGDCWVDGRGVLVGVGACRKLPSLGPRALDPVESLRLEFEEYKAMTKELMGWKRKLTDAWEGK